MFVRPEYRGPDHQVARRLLENHEKRIYEIDLGTTTKFVAAHRFYEKCGFAEILKADLPAVFPVMSVDTKFFMRALTAEDAARFDPCSGPVIAEVVAGCALYACGGNR